VRIELRLGFYSHQLTVPRGYGRKRTVACFADAFARVTRHDEGMRYVSPFTMYGRAFFVGLRMRIADGA
jgi:hypothetical protein